MVYQLDIEEYIRCKILEYYNLQRKGKSDEKDTIHIGCCRIVIGNSGL